MACGSIVRQQTGSSAATAGEHATSVPAQRWKTTRSSGAVTMRNRRPIACNARDQGCSARHARAVASLHLSHLLEFWPHLRQIGMSAASETQRRHEGSPWSCRRGEADPTPQTASPHVRQAELQQHRTDMFWFVVRQVQGICRGASLICRNYCRVEVRQHLHARLLRVLLASIWSFDMADRALCGWLRCFPGSLRGRSAVTHV